MFKTSRQQTYSGPPNFAYFYHNYKEYHTLVLMTITNANYEFIYYKFDANGRISDGKLFENTKFV